MKTMRLAIDEKKCIQCGACVYQCPFGAITDRSYILNVIDMIKKSNNNQNYKVFAIVAPAIASQFTYAKYGQVVKGLKELGFDTVVEAAFGADMVALEESKELSEKGFLTSSCCRLFLILKMNSQTCYHLYLTTPSPMAALAKYIKTLDASAKVVFVGPCTAKKAEAQLEEVKPYVDAVITFEELQALYDSKEIDLTKLEDTPLDNASYFGRIFARSGGLTEAVGQALKEQNIEFEVKPIVCDGIEACRMALLKKRKNVLDGNFIEGMACIGGCIGGAGCLTHGDRNKMGEKHGKEAKDKAISESLKGL